jgi:hypothetical protein
VVPVGGSTYTFGPHILLNLLRCVPQMIVPDLRFTNYLAMLSAHLPPAAVHAATLGALVCIGLLTLGAVWVRFRGDALSRFAVVWCYVAFLPYAAFRYDYALAPRYLYLPSVGLALLLGHWLGSWHHRRPRHIVLGAVLALFVAVNYLPLHVMTAHRLRDSQIRRTALASVGSVVKPDATSVSVFVLGLPQYLQVDFTDAVHAWVPPGREATVQFVAAPPRLSPGQYAITLAPNGSLVSSRAAQ